MKKRISMLLVIVLSLSMILTNVAIADNNVKVNFNGKQMQFDQPPIIQDGRTLVPVRAIFEAIGAEVEWNSRGKTITATKCNTEIQSAPPVIRGVNITIVMQIDSPVMYKNGGKIELDTSATIIGDRTLVPVRAVSEAFDCEVKWDDSSKTVDIIYNENVEKEWVHRAKDSFSRPILGIDTVGPVYYDENIQFEVYKYKKDDKTNSAIERFKKDVIRLGFYLDKNSTDSILIYKGFSLSEEESFFDDRIEIHFDKDPDYIIMYQRGAAG